MRRKSLMYLLTFSLALNAATGMALAVFWWQNQTLAAVSLGQKPIRRFLQDDLHLSNDQSSVILGHIDRSKQEATALRGSMDSKRAEMINLICSTPIDKSAVTTKMEEITNIQRKMRATAVKTVITILEGLPAESRDKFGAYLHARGRACDVCCTPASGPQKATSGR